MLPQATPHSKHVCAPIHTPLSSGGCMGDQEPQGGDSGHWVCGPGPAFPGVSGALGFLWTLLQHLPHSAGPSLSLPRPPESHSWSWEGDRALAPQDHEQGPRWAKLVLPRAHGQQLKTVGQGLCEWGPSPSPHPRRTTQPAPAPALLQPCPSTQTSRQGPPAQSCPPLGGWLVSVRKLPSSQALTFSPEPPRRASVERPQAGSGLQGWPPTPVRTSQR